MLSRLVLFQLKLKPRVKSTHDDDDDMGRGYAKAFLIA
jgi:hypothetical protein